MRTFYKGYYSRNNKYGAVKTQTIDGAIHDSRKEARRWTALQLLQRAGEISELRRQVPFKLLPAQENERPVNYIADFVYKDKDGQTVVEDVKSEATRKKPEYVIKRKLMLYIHGIKIKEV